MAVSCQSNSKQVGSGSNTSCDLYSGLILIWDSNCPDWFLCFFPSPPSRDYFPISLPVPPKFTKWDYRLVTRCSGTTAVVTASLYTLWYLLPLRVRAWSWPWQLPPPNFHSSLVRLSLLLLIQEVSVPNLSVETGYRERYSVVFFSPFSRMLG
jgi:hypothetical protein